MFYRCYHYWTVHLTVLVLVIKLLSQSIPLFLQRSDSNPLVSVPFSTRSGLNSSETVASTTSEAFCTSLLHHALLICFNLTAS